MFIILCLLLPSLDRPLVFSYNNTCSIPCAVQAPDRQEGYTVGGTITATEAHKQYNEAITAFRKLIPDPALRMTFSRQVDGYMRQYVLGVWQADNASSTTPRHVEFYNAIYSAGNSVPSALYWEVATGVASFDLFRPPAFFEDLRRYDRMRGTSLARRFADQLRSEEHTSELQSLL